MRSARFHSGCGMTYVAGKWNLLNLINHQQIFTRRVSHRPAKETERNCLSRRFQAAHVHHSLLVRLLVRTRNILLSFGYNKRKSNIRNTYHSHIWRRKEGLEFVFRGTSKETKLRASNKSGIKSNIDQKQIYENGLTSTWKRTSGPIIHGMMYLFRWEVPSLRHVGAPQ